MTPISQFEPGPDRAADLRAALGQFATGVTVITCQYQGAPIAMTVNSFASVSLDPALVLWSIARSSKRFDAFFNAPAFSIHVLGVDHKPLCDRFARDGRNFDGVDMAKAPLTQTPVVMDALARFDCVTHQKHDGGDHVILVGRIAHVMQSDGAPLVFAQGRYGPPSAQSI